jgi:Ribbon-helix-helix protein, copG family
MMYSARVKRIQIYIDDASDELLSRRARREGRSKAALIRDAVRREYGGAGPADPFDAWAGGIDERPGDVDELVYGR